MLFSISKLIEHIKMAMKRLPTKVRSLFSASTFINSYVKAIEELVYNALDAHATSIAIRLHIQENLLQVIDNGDGISKYDMRNVGNRYLTSKTVDLQTLKSAPNSYGYRGLSLAAIIEISEDVIITSRVQNSEETWIKKIYKKIVNKLVLSLTRPSKGTTVEIRGFLYNLIIQKQSVNPWTEIQNTKQFIQKLALVHQNISISLRDDSKNEIIFQLHKCRDIYQTLSTVLSINKDEMQELQVEKKSYKVIAYIGKKASDDNEYHWIYLNGRFMPSCSLHKILNKTMAKSLCLKKQNRIKKTVTLFSENFETYFQKNIPFYFVFITCPYNDYDINTIAKQCTVEFKKWDDIKKLLEKLVLFFIGDAKVKEKKILQNIVERPDTKDKIKEIMEDILRSTKKFGVSQMQNGVKGKIVKKKNNNSNISKKIQKENYNKTLLNETSKKQLTESGNLHKELSTDIEVTTLIKPTVKKSIHKADVTNYKKIKPILLPNKNIKKIKLIKRTPKKRKKDEYNFILKQNKILKEKEKNIIKRKTKENDFELKLIPAKKNSLPPKISQKYVDNHKFFPSMNNNNHEILNCYDDGVIPIPYKLDAKTMSYILKRIKDKQYTYTHDLVHTVLSSQHAANNINMKVCVPDEKNTFRLPTFRSNIRKKFNENQLKSSRYLLNTILESQLNNKCNVPSQMYINTESSKSPKYLDHNIFPRKENFEMFNDTCSQKLTYESHRHYRYVEANSCAITDELHSFDNIPRIHQFITKESKDNFQITKECRTFKKHKSNNKHSTSFYHRKPAPLQLKRQYCKESSYSIEFSESVKDGFRNHKRITNSAVIPAPDVNATYTVAVSVEEETNKMYKNISIPLLILSQRIEESNSRCKEQETEINDKINDEFCRHDDINSMQNVRDLTPSICDLDSSFQILSREDIDLQKHLNIVFISNSPNHTIQLGESHEKDMNPINVCEIVLNSPQITDSLINLDNNLIYNNIPLDNEIYTLPSQAMATYNAVEEISHHFHENRKDSPDNLFPGDLNSENTTKLNSPNTVLNRIDMVPKFNEQVNLKIAVKDVNEKDDFDFNLRSRPRFIPKGMSPIFTNCNTRNACDYNFEEDYFDDEMYNDFVKAVETNTEVFETNIENVNNALTKEINKVSAKLKKDNASLNFNGENLKEAKVLGQVDNKFIAAKMKGKAGSSGLKEFLILFDQHAVHERIRLEANLAGYLENDHQWSSVNLDEVNIKLKPDEILYLHNYKDKFEQFGLKWTVIDKGLISVVGIPTAILGKHERQAEIIMKAVKSLISEQTEILKTQKGSISLYSKSIMDLVFSEACRYAIKFGDKLSEDACIKLLADLSECNTPFQCAHGRPVMAVLMDVQTSHKTYKINYSKLTEFKKR